MLLWGCLLVLIKQLGLDSLPIPTGQQVDIPAAVLVFALGIMVSYLNGVLAAYYSSQESTIIAREFKNVIRWFAAILVLVGAMALIVRGDGDKNYR